MSYPAVRHALAAVVVVTSLGALTACGSVDDAEPERTSFALTGSSLTIRKDSGDLKVRPADVEEVEVTRWFTGDADEATWKLADDKLTLRTDCGFLSSCEVRYEVLVPRETAVEVVGENGRVDARDFTGSLSVTTENGAIDVADVSGDLTLRSTSGDQSVTGSSSPQVDAQAENGTISLSFDGPPTAVAVQTDNGSVTLHVPDVAYAVEVDTDSGSVKSSVEEDPESPRRIEVTTDNGSVTLRPQG